VAMDSTERCGAKGFSWSRWLARAKRIALVNCARRGGRKCTLRAWVCDAR
jgi:hypothetical protein